MSKVTKAQEMTGEAHAATQTRATTPRPEAPPDHDSAGSDSLDGNTVLLPEAAEGLQSLRMAAEAGDERDFRRIMRQMNWDGCTATEFEQAIALALATGAPLAARELAMQGAAQHPASQELQKMARVLAPPRVVQTCAPNDPAGVKANQEWLHTHAAAYRGQWVALRRGQLLGAAASLRELKERSGALTGTFVTHIS
ncbi:MAG: hypothetical protein M3347_17865 [Armatimonadota bacterium]|nr:hypothetical protein [Armatimonadota bacterium]